MRLIGIIFFLWVIVFSLMQFSCASKDPLYYYNEGRKQQMSTNSLEALKLLNRAIKLKPDFYDAYYQKAEVYLSLDSIESAIKNYDICLSLTKEQDKIGELFFLKGNAFYLNSQDSLACKNWKLAQDLNYLKADDRIRKHCKKTNK